MPLAAGTRLGPYEILSPLGAGGMGEVHRARDTRLGRDVAVKVLPDHLADDPKALARFESEARAVAALSHPNILFLLDVGETNGIHYAFTELLEGEPLRALVTRGALPLRRALEIAHHVGDALAAAHEKGIVHCDVKPENVFLTRDGHVKLLDFGLARQVNRYGYLMSDVRNVVKLSGSYRVPTIETNVAVTYVYRSGKPWTPWDYDPIGWGDVYLEPRGSRRTPVLHNVDLQLEKRFRLDGVAGGLSISALATVYNLLGTETATTVESYVGSELYGQPTVWTQPRALELGARVEF